MKVASNWYIVNKRLVTVDITWLYKTYGKENENK
jgi:hypothetical protein